VAEADAAPSDVTAARLVSFSRPVIERSFGAQPAATRTAAATTRTATPTETKYTVTAGDTLSSIAQRVYHNPRYWPVLYQANHQEIQYASEITAGEVLIVPAKPAKIPAAPSGDAPALSSAAGQTSATADAPAATAPVAEVSTTVSTAGDSSFQACVIARESGGNSQVMNASGHYGLYQFSASTWAEYGGNPADFGHASVAEQNQVFDNAIAAGGESNWSAYDGC
jgi:LysM repeat protein